MGKSNCAKECEEAKKCEEKAPKCPAEAGKGAPKAGKEMNLSEIFTKSVLELPHFLRRIGPKQVKILMSFAPSALIYGLTSALLITYVSDWKSVLQYLPYYNGKYPDPPKKDE